MNIYANLSWLDFILGVVVPVLLAAAVVAFLVVQAVRALVKYARAKEGRSGTVKQTKLYNVILPIWLLLLFPQVWLIVVPGNLIVDCGVLLLALLVLRHRRKKDVLKKLWWKFWLLGFAADAAGLVWMFLGWVLSVPLGEAWENTVGHITHNAFAHPAAFLWMLAGVALAGVCIYFFDKKAMAKCGLLTPRETQIIALTMAIVTAPWLFFIPVY